MQINILVTFVILAQTKAALEPVSVQVFQYAYFQGASGYYRTKDGCTDFSSIGEYIASLKMPVGSCAQMYSTNNCRVTNITVAYPTLEVEILPKEIYHNLNSIKPCPTNQVNVVCPNGTFVRRVDWSNDDALTHGITIYCYFPANRTATVVYNTHGRNLVTFSSQTCKGAARGIAVVRNNSTRMITAGQASCQYLDSIGSDYRQCDKSDALIGLRVQIESTSMAIKSISSVCQFVEDPVKLCLPVDEYVFIVVCDNAQGTTSTECQYSQTVGVGISQELTVSQSSELNFYGEFQFGAGGDVGVEAVSLSASFSAKLGLSLTTGYNWAKSASSTWESQATIQVTVAAPPGVITRLEQVVGYCSFYSVYVNYYKRVDTYGNGTVIIQGPVLARQL